MSILKNEIPILEFDAEQNAVIDSTHENLDIKLPPKCVFAFLNLSFLTLRQESCPNYPELDGQDYIVLNSVSNVNKALYPLGSYERIHCFFDNDHAGMEALQQIRKEYGRDRYIRDASQIYRGCKDLNEYLQKQVERKRQVQSVKGVSSQSPKKKNGFRL